MIERPAGSNREVHWLDREVWWYTEREVCWLQLRGLLAMIERYVGKVLALSLSR